MSITIESPTAEAALEALQKLPSNEMERLKVLLNGQVEGESAEENAWRAASMLAAARFFDEEEQA